MLGVGDFCPEVEGLEYVKGKHVVINGKPREMALVVEFWATWCPPCLDSIPHLTELQHRFRSIEFVGISSEKSAKVSPFVDSMGAKMDYSVALDATGAASRELMAAAGARGIPHAFVIGKSGKILFSGHPMDGEFEEALKKASVEGGVQKEVRPLNYTREELTGMPVKELKTILLDHGKTIVGLLEKREFIDKILELGEAS